MKYCLPYNSITSKSQQIIELDEWTIDYNPSDKTLIKFLENNSDKRINLKVKDKLSIKKIEDLKFLEDLCEKFQNLYIEFDIFIKNQYQELLDSNIRYFFDDYIVDWDRLHEIIDFKVSDVYIAETLGFELDKVSTFVHNTGVRIRVFH